MGIQLNSIEQEAKINALVSELTLEEKIGMIHGAALFHTKGVDRLNIPPLSMSDGPMGVRHDFEDAEWKTIGQSYDYVTYLPSNTALASTWNTDCAYRSGQVLGCEARGRGKDVILAPGINIHRSPLCGRNFEYFSEDPKLIEEMAVPMIEGIQEFDVAACVKHFVANNQETERLGVDTFMDDRTLREVYLPGFRAAIKRANCLTIMSAYNRLRGELCSESELLLNGILRYEWNYDGTVISDWSAIWHTKEAAEAEVDVEMSVRNNFDEYCLANPLLKSIKAGEIKEELVDKKVKNILRLMYRLKMLGIEKENRQSGTYNMPEHREAVLNVAREAVVVLKNEENRLPLKKKGCKTIAVIGQNANIVHSNGGGSAEIKALYEITPLMGITKQIGGNCTVQYAKGYYIPSKEQVNNINWQATSTEHTKEVTLSAEELIELEKKQKAAEEEIKEQKKLLLEEAVALAKSADEVIYVGGLTHDLDTEGFDRADMFLPYGQVELIQAIIEVKPKVVITIVSGSPVSLCSFVEKAKAIVWTSYAGMEGGTALAEVIFGDVNPSGKLPVTLPKQLSNSPAHVYGEFATKMSVTYKEGLLVGYRYYDTKKVEPEFCFGHGLSYTDFNYKNLEVAVNEGTSESYYKRTGKSKFNVTKQEVEEKSELTVTVKLTVKNTGKVAGAEVVQIYVSDKEATVKRPVHELKGFTKVFLEPSEEKEVTIVLHEDAFGFYQEEKHCFVVEPGEFVIEVAASSRDIRTTKEITVKRAYGYGGTKY